MSFECCQNCVEKRFPGCHDECEDYKIEKSKINEINKKRRRENEITSVKNELYYERNKKWNK